MRLISLFVYVKIVIIVEILSVISIFIIFKFKGSDRSIYLFTKYHDVQCIFFMHYIRFS